MPLQDLDAFGAGELLLPGGELGGISDQRGGGRKLAILQFPEGGGEGGIRGGKACVLPLFGGEPLALGLCVADSGVGVGLGSAQLLVLGTQPIEFSFETGSRLGAGAQLRDFVAQAHEFEFGGLGFMVQAAGGGSGGFMRVSKFLLKTANTGVQLLIFGGKCVALVPDEGSEGERADQQKQE